MERNDEVGKEIAENIAHGIARGIARGIAIGIALTIAFALFILLGGLVVQWLWNWLVPDIFGLRQLTFWQALGLLALCRILFGNFGRGGHHRNHGKHRGEWWKRRRSQESLATSPNHVSEGGRS
jgi:MFS family permease